MYLTTIQFFALFLIYGWEDFYTGFGHKHARISYFENQCKKYLRVYTFTLKYLMLRVIIFFCVTRTPVQFYNCEMWTQLCLVQLPNWAVHSWNICGSSFIRNDQRPRHLSHKVHIYYNEHVQSFIQYVIINFKHTVIFYIAIP